MAFKCVHFYHSITFEFDTVELLSAVYMNIWFDILVFLG